jgi:hypothetical protein
MITGEQRAPRAFPNFDAHLPWLEIAILFPRSVPFSRYDSLLVADFPDINAEFRRKGFAPPWCSLRDSVK